jgi:uncharacterized protein (UPF0147 family)
MDDKTCPCGDSIINLLASRHSSDIFVPECKNGSSYGGHLRLDAWAMKKAWTNPLTIGYEIKKSRSDFLNDTKWMNYLQYCNEFYFVCPFGLIQPEEISNEIGLIWASKNQTRLYTKKKSPYRTIGLDLEDVYKYILLWRAKIVTEHHNSKQSEKSYWQYWLAEKDENKDLGYRVSKKIRELVSSRITSVHHENQQLEARCKKLEAVEKIVTDLNLPIWHWNMAQEIREKLRLFKQSLPEGFEESLVRLRGQIDQTLAIIEGKKNEE